MAQDAFGNYVCEVETPPLAFLPSSMGGASSGNGPPDDNDGTPDGSLYVDWVGLNIYIKSGGVYIIYTGPAGGSGEVCVGSPEGVITASPGTTCVDPVNHALWVKESGVGNVGWLQYI